MNHPSSDPIEPPDPSQGHERTDVAAKPIVYFLIGLVVFGGVVQLSMSAVMVGFVHQDTKAPLPQKNILRDTGAINRPAPLQQNTTADMIRMYEEEDEVLTTYRVDPKTKAIRVPLDRAMDVLAKKGLPHRADSPKDMPGSDPIPHHGKAYQTTD